MNQITKIKIKPYQDNDATDLANIYFNTIHLINSQDYNKKQIQAWAPSADKFLNKRKDRWKSEPPLVATINNTLVGFCELESNGYIDCFYVHHQFQGNGVGTALLSAAELRALENNLTRIYAEVSITAKPFFLSKGFLIKKEQQVKLNGVELTNFLMEKLLS